MGLNALTDKIRATHPGAYDDMDDATLTKKVLSKYPQYSDLAAPKVAAPLPSALQGKPSFEERAAGRFEQNVRAPAQMLDMAPKAISEGIQQAQSGNFQMTDRGKAEAFPFGQQNLARKIAGLATMPQRQVYGQAKDLIQSWMQDPANAVGDIGAAALPLADAKLPANARYAARGATTEAGPTAGSLLRQELASRIPLAKRFGVHGVTVDQLIDLMKGKAAAPEAPVPTGPPSMWGKMIESQVPGESMADWWARRGGKFAGQETPPARPTPTPSPTTPPPAPEPDMEMLRRQAGIRPEATELGVNQVPVAQRASTIIPQEEQAAIASRVEGRGASKASIEKGSVPSTLTETGVKADQNALKQVQAERPDLTLSQQLQEAAKRMKTARSPRADLLEDKGIMERMQASMEADRVKAAQEYRANNTITTTKGELIEKATPKGRTINTSQPTPPQGKGVMATMGDNGQLTVHLKTPADVQWLKSRGIQAEGVGDKVLTANERELVYPSLKKKFNDMLSDRMKRTGTVEYTTTPPAPAKVDLNDSSTLQDLLKKSVKQAKAKKR